LVLDNRSLLIDIVKTFTRFKKHSFLKLFFFSFTFFAFLDNGCYHCEHLLTVSFFGRQPVQRQHRNCLPIYKFCQNHAI